MAFGLWGANGEIPPLLFCESNLVPLSGIRDIVRRVV